MILKSLPESILESAQKYSGKIALRYKKGGVIYKTSYKRLAQDINNFSNVLSSLGVVKGDRLAILSNNCPEWAVFDLSTMMLGGISVPIHTTLSPQIISYILNHCQAKILLVRSSELLNKILLIQNELDCLEKIIYVGQLELGIKKMSKIKIIDWEELITNKKSIIKNPITLNPDDICSIIYTSGTTGRSKGVCLTHQNFLSDISSVLQSIPIFSSDLFLSFLPLSHVLERTTGYYLPLLVGASIAYAEGIKELPKNLKEFKPTILICVPRVLEKFHDKIYDKIKSGPGFVRNLFFYALKQSEESWSLKLLDKIIFSKIRNNLGGNLRFIVSGGASLNLTIAKFFKKIGLIILEGYGLTESSPVITVNKLNNFKFGTVGLPISEVEVKISADREILVRGDIVMSGYYKNKSETLEAVDQDGFLHTGDLGFIDQDGFLTIIGRKKEMMVTSGGKNIWPDHLEQLINIDKYISQSIVIAHNRRFVSALIVPDWQEVNNYWVSNNLPIKTREEMLADIVLLKLIKERVGQINYGLPEYEQIKQFNLLAEEFSEAKDELTPTLKLRRQAIETNYKKQIDKMYE